MALWLVWVAGAGDPQADLLAWAVQAENAAINVKQAAATLRDTAAEVAAEGRIGRMWLLREQADELYRRAELLERVLEVAPGGDAGGGAAGRD